MDIRELTLNAYGKVNLALDVLRRREDGYHDLRMIMQTVDLFDTISITTIEKGIEITSEQMGVPCDERNLMYKAAALMQQTYKLECGFKMHLVKRIPMAAGMAGGSTDAAAVFNGINQLLGLDISQKELCKLGVKIGADVPYCICGGTMLSEGIGEVLTRLQGIESYPVVIAKPNFDVSTKFVYQNLCVDKLVSHPDIAGMIEAIQESDCAGVCCRLGNVLETVTAENYPQIDELKTKMLDYGAINSLMSGSGPTVFGIFSTDQKATEAATRLLTKYPNYQICATNFITP